MDLATCITEVAASTFKKECLQNVCHIKLKVHNRYEYTISITPMAKHILIAYESLEYKVARNDASAYQDIIDYLISAIDYDIAMCLNDDIEYCGYFPDNDGDFHRNTLIIERHEKKAFVVDFKRCKFKDVVKMHMKCMLYLN